jgi:two-component system cell cycle sensor histidine kinase/response regulator CckA
MSGQELAETLSYLRPNMKVLFVSGYSDTDLGDGMLDPRVELLQKPFAPHELSRKIREIMGRTEPEISRGALQMRFSI